MKVRIKYNKFLANRTRALVMLGLIITSTGCKKWYGIPEDKDFLSDKAELKTKNYTPVLGRTTIISGNLDADGSTTPLSYEIINVRNSDGTPTDSLTTTRPAYVWIDDYDGTEQSIEEIEKKRKLENRPAFEVRRSGEFYLWASATNSVLQNYQGAIAPALSDGYLFDVKISNSGGSRVLKDLTLRPLRERPYEPSERDPLTGIQTAPITPSITNIIGATSRKPLSNSYTGADTIKRDVRILFRKTGNGNSLTFKFLDKSFKTIDPHLFKLTDWANLVHGFNWHFVGTEAVKYDVAYPIPLTNRPTAYTTSNGAQASVRFGYDRLGFNGIKQHAYIVFAFNIYEKGDWEIAVQFRRENPRFENE